MSVYVVIVTYPYEFSKILGVFYEAQKANEFLLSERGKDDATGFNGEPYNQYEVEEHEVK